MTDLIPNDLGHFEGNEIPQDFEFESDFHPHYNYDLICPQCGGNMRTVGGNYADECQYDLCEECGYQTELDC